MGVEFAASVGARSPLPTHQLQQSAVAKALPRQHALPASAAGSFTFVPMHLDFLSPAFVLAAPQMAGARSPADTALGPREAPPPLPAGAELGAQDFRRFQLQSMAAESATSFELSLKTQDGDTLTLSFNQVDTVRQLRFAGQFSKAGGVRLDEISQASNRAMTMSVSGNLSEAELSAIDGILAQVQEVASEFFRGSMGEVMEKLQALDFDAATLAELSLDISVSQSLEFTRAYMRPRNGDATQLQGLADRDAGIKSALQYFADAQRQLIGMASQILDSASSVSLVKGLLPPVVQQQLQDRLLAEANQPARTDDLPAAAEDDA